MTLPTEQLSGVDWNQLVLDDLRELLQTIRNDWPGPTDFPSPSIDERLDSLRYAAIQCGILSKNTNRVVPAGRTLVSLALGEWTEDPSLQLDAWNRFQSRIDEVATAIELINATSLDSRQSQIPKRVLQLVEMMRADAELLAQGKKTKSPERQAGYARLRAAKSDQPEIYAHAEKLYEAELAGKCRLG